MIYAIYKNNSNSSNKCLIDFNITEFPVNIIKIARNAGVSLRRNNDVGALTGGESGAAFYDKSLDKWYIVYDDDTSLARCRMIIAHELGHIFLGHKLAGNAEQMTFVENNDLEVQADQFAIQLLAPACVLLRMNIHSAEQIVNICDISMIEAKKRALVLTELYALGTVFSSFEEQVCEQFNDWISSYNSTLSI